MMKKNEPKYKIPAAKVYFPPEDRAKLVETLNQILMSGQLTLGAHGKQFEEKFAEYVGTKYAVSVNSGTAALEIILRSMKVKKDDSIAIPTNTFFATALAVMHSGAYVDFVDSSKDMNMDPNKLQEAIHSGTKGVILVHIGGSISPNVKAIREICEDHKLFLIEDAAHAHGSTLNGKQAGSFGTAGAFSFYPTKVMTSGEGGMITTDDKDIYDKALVLRDQGKSSPSENIHIDMGYNWRMSEIHAAIGLSHLGRLNEFIGVRRNVASIYDQMLKDIPDITPVPVEGKSNYYKYCAVLKEGVKRSYVKRELKDQFGVSLSGEVYEIPCHLQPLMSNLYGEGAFPVAEDLCRRHICLPVYANMTNDEAIYVIDSLREVIE